jgi:glycerophosphoryl diester phosphodiesterase
MELVAHRGNALDFPENTLSAFESALLLGARWLELDVQLSSDHVPVVIHDPLLARTTGLPGSVFDHPASALCSFNAGEPGRFGARFGAVRLPLLTEVLALIATRPEVTLFVEIKTESLEYFGHPLVVGRVLEALEALPRQCVVISFDLPAVRRARQLGGLPIGWVLTSYDDSAREQCAALAPDFVFCNHRKFPAASALWAGPWRWASYEVRSAALAHQLAARGVPLIETMAIGELSAALSAGRAQEA